MLLQLHVQCSTSLSGSLRIRAMKAWIVDHVSSIVAMPRYQCTAPVVYVCIIALHTLLTRTAAAAAAQTSADAQSIDQTCTAGESCSSEIACTRPLLPQEATKPFCHTPTTVSIQAQQFLKSVAARTLPSLTEHATAEALRATYKAMIAPVSAAAAEKYFADIHNDTIAGVPVTLATPMNFNPAQSEGKLLVYIHGGGYVFGSCYYSYQNIALLAHYTGVRVLCVEYRLAPEHPYPAAVDDALAVYKALLDQYEPSSLAYLGESAGGGLAVAMVQQAQQQQLPLPGALLLIAPWVDLGNRGDTMTTNTALDTLQYDLNLKKMALAYLGGQDETADGLPTTDPGVSPLHGDFSPPFPPTLIQVGLREVFLSDCTLLYRKMKAAGVEVVFSPWEGMWHGFQSSIDVPEAQQAHQEMAEFMLQHLNSKA